MIHEPSTSETTPVDRPPQRGVLLAAFAPLFSHCLGTKAQARAVGALLATGPRTVWAVLRILGQSRDRPFLNSHRVLNRDAWSGLAAGQILLGRILALIPGDGPLVLAPTTPSSAAAAAGSGPGGVIATPCAGPGATSSAASAGSGSS